MNNVIQFATRDDSESIVNCDKPAEVVRLHIRFVFTSELKQLWDEWDGDPCKKLAEFEHEAVYFELNRRGEGKYCAV